MCNNKTELCSGRILFIMDDGAVQVVAFEANLLDFECVTLVQEEK